MTSPVDFTIVLRGYDPAPVDDLVRRAQVAIESGSLSARATLQHELSNLALRVRFRGYDRVQVDDYLRRLAESLA